MQWICPYEQMHYLNNCIIIAVCSICIHVLWEFPWNTLLISLYTAKSRILSVIFNDTISISIPLNLLRLYISDSYNKLLIETRDLGCLKAVTLDVGIAK